MPGANGPPLMEHRQLTVPTQELLSDTIRLARDGLVKALKEAHFTGKTLHLGPDNMVSTLNIMHQLAVRIEKLEGVEHEQVPEPAAPEPEPEPSKIIV